MQPVTVLFLLPGLPVGGAERQIASLITGMDSRRFRPLVACQHRLGPVAEDLSAAGFPVHLLSCERSLDPAFLFRLAGLMRRERVQLVLSHGFSTGVVGRIAGVLSGVPARILAEHSTGERDLSPLRHRLNRLLAPLTAAWVSVADGQLDYLTREKRIPVDRIHRIYNGIESGALPTPEERASARQLLGIPGDVPVAGVIAVLRPEKDHRTFLLAARLTLDSLPEAQFLLIGDGPERTHLEREIVALGLTESVRILGFRQDVARLLPALDVSVLSSTDVETLPMAFLESMAAGLPLVATRVGGLPELIDEGSNGLLVPPRDPGALSEALSLVLKDPAKARAWGQESHRRVTRDFSRLGMVRAYEDLFAELLQARGVSLPERSVRLSGERTQ
ncbi:MAG: glycosyltransferase [Gemmatimonadota bacterium]|jgi:glycosyltransferase involved in cell wall biosynthesis|nr:glycosyltransferase [Gemmatimonadota bacterium]